MRRGKGPARSGERERFWRRIISGQPGSSLSIREWCAQHQVSEPSFYAWRRELARRDAQRRDTRHGDAGRRNDHPSPSRPEFVELNAVTHLLGPSLGASPTMPTGGARESAIQIVVADVRVTVGPGFDGETLGRLLGLLRNMSEATGAC